MADIFTNRNIQIANDLAYTDPKDNEEVKKSQSSTYNPYHHETRELFSDYFVNRHDANGHIHTARWDALKPEQVEQFDHYVERKEFESGLREKGYTEDKIALLRQWDDDMKDAMLSGTYDKLIASGKMLDREYREKAIAQYQWDEAMFDKYVSTSKYIAQQIYTPDANGVFNLTEDALTEMRNMSKEDLADMYSWMGEEQKRMLDFDGIHTDEQFANYAKTLSNVHYETTHRSKDFWGKLGDFFKSVAHGFVAAITESLTLIPSLVGAVVGVVAGWDNALTRWTTNLKHKAEEAITGNFDNAINMDDVDKDSWAYKVGNIAGQGVELVAEATLTMGGSVLLKKGVSKLTTKMARKKLTRAVEQKLGDKAIAKAEAKLAKGISKRIEMEAMKIARQKGARKVDAAMMHEAAERASIGLGLTKGAAESIEKKVIEGIENATITATARLARRGMLTVEKEGLEAMAEGATKTLIKEGTKTGLIKVVAKKGVKAAEKTVVKEGEKVAAKEAVKKGAKAWLGHQKTGFINRTKTIAKEVVAAGGAKSADEKMLALTSRLMAKPGVISRTLRAGFGNTDAFTKMFALKAFTSTLEQSGERGYKFYEAIPRAIFAAASTNAIWGKLHFGKLGDGMNKMVDKIIKPSAEMTGVVSKIFTGTLTATLDVGTKMIADGFLQQAILEGFGKDLNGEDQKWSQIFKDNFSIKNISEKFLSALTMHTASSITGVAVNGFNLGTRKVFMIDKKELARTWDYIETTVARSEDEAVKNIVPLWENYKERARAKFEKDGNEDPSVTEVAEMAYSLAIAEQSGDLINAIQKPFITYRAVKFGRNLAESYKILESDIDKDMLELNMELNETMGGDKREETSSPEARAFFRAFLLNKTTKNLQGFDGDVVNEKLGIKGEAYTAREILAAWHFYSAKFTKGEKLTAENLEYAVSRVDSARETFGPEMWKKVQSFEKEAFLWLVKEMEDVKTRGKAIKYINFRTDINKVVKKHEALHKKKVEELKAKAKEENREFNEEEAGDVFTKEFYNDLSKVIQKNGMTAEKVNNEIASGNPDAQKIQEDVNVALNTDQNTILNEKEHPQTIANELIEKYSDEMGDERVKLIFEEAEKAKRDGIAGVKLTNRQYADVISALYEKFQELNRTSHKDAKKLDLNRDEIKRFKAIHESNKFLQKLWAKNNPEAAAEGGRWNYDAKGIKSYINAKIATIKRIIPEIKAAIENKQGLSKLNRAELERAKADLKEIKDFLDKDDENLGQINELLGGDGVNAVDINNALSDADVAIHNTKQNDLKLQREREAATKSVKVDTNEDPKFIFTNTEKQTKTDEEKSTTLDEQAKTTVVDVDDAVPIANKEGNTEQDDKEAQEIDKESNEICD